VKTLWLALSVLAVANVLALLGVVGWLQTSNRLDGARLEQVRQLFSKTVKQTAEEAAQLKTAAQAEIKNLEEQSKAARPALTAEERLHARVEATEIDRQRAQRLSDENISLQRSLAEKLTQFEALKSQIAQAKQEFEQLTSKSRETVGAEQFKKTLGVLEALKPERAKAALKEIMLATAQNTTDAPPQPRLASPKDGAISANTPTQLGATMTDPAAAGKAQVVSYLNAMDEGIRAKVIQEFLKDDPKLAAELLEKLRVRGVPPVIRGAQANDPSR